VNLDVAVTKDEAKPYPNKGKGIAGTAERRKRRGKPPSFKPQDYRIT
jgi:hypothetical protein